MLYVQFTNVSPSPNSFGCVNNLLILLFLKSLITSSRFFVLEVSPTPLYFSANCSISCWNWHQMITGLSPTSSKQSSNTLFLLVSKSVIVPSLLITNPLTISLSFINFAVNSNFDHSLILSLIFCNISW